MVEASISINYLDEKTRVLELIELSKLLGENNSIEFCIKIEKENQENLIEWLIILFNEFNTNNIKNITFRAVLCSEYVNDLYNGGNQYFEDYHKWFNFNSVDISAVERNIKKIHEIDYSNSLKRLKNALIIIPFNEKSFAFSTLLNIYGIRNLEQVSQKDVTNCLEGREYSLLVEYENGETEYKKYDLNMVNITFNHKLENISEAFNRLLIN